MPELPDYTVLYRPVPRARNERVLRAVIIAALAALALTLLAIGVTVKSREQNKNENQTTAEIYICGFTL